MFTACARASKAPRPKGMSVALEAKRTAECFTAGGRLVKFITEDGSNDSEDSGEESVQHDDWLKSAANDAVPHIDIGGRAVVAPDDDDAPTSDTGGSAYDSTEDRCDEIMREQRAASVETMLQRAQRELTRASAAYARLVKKVRRLGAGDGPINVAALERAQRRCKAAWVIQERRAIRLSQLQDRVTAVVNRVRREFEVKKKKQAKKQAQSGAVPPRRSKRQCAGVGIGAAE